MAKNIDAIAVTVGPGLIGSLLVGVETAKTLSYLWGKPIVPVNHLAAHIYANWLVGNSKSEARNPKQTQNPKFKIQNTNHQSQVINQLPQFPTLALVVSGGHTDLVLMKGHGKLKWVGGTRDDAAGEAFDKCARLLGLGYPGGPAISAAAEKFLKENPKNKLNLFPRPMMKNFSAKMSRWTLGWDWSFSGLKTSVLRTVQSTKNIEQRIPELSAEIQEAIVDVLVEKTFLAIKKFKPKSLLLAGGVAANNRLRKKFQEKITNEIHEKVSFHVPPVDLCTDNATYIAAYAHFNYHPVDWRKISANPGLTIVGEA